MNPRLSIEPPSRLRRGVAVGITVFSLLLLLAIGAWTWILRDGLGPDSIESSGMQALRRFFTDFWPVALFCFVLFVIAFFINLHQSPTSNASTNRAGND